MNPHDSAYQFSFLKDSLVNLKVKIHQIDNMVNVVLARLISYRREKKLYPKHMKTT
jgi:hypothetical protein